MFADYVYSTILSIQTRAGGLNNSLSLLGDPYSHHLVTGMKETGSPKLLFENLDLTPIHTILWTDLHTEGPGRPPRNPLGIFKALMTKRLRQIPSDRELYRRLWNDPLLRMICDIEERETPYPPS